MIIKIRDSQRRVNEPSQIAALLRSYFKITDVIDWEKEHFFVFHLDSRSKIKIFELVSIGTINASLVHPREVFTRALASRSVFLIIAHNHPSEDEEPSNEDIAITRRLVDIGKIVGIEVIDHVIYTKKSFYSFKERGLI